MWQWAFLSGPSSESQSFFERRASPQCTHRRSPMQRAPSFHPTRGLIAGESKVLFLRRDEMDSLSSQKNVWTLPTLLATTSSWPAHPTVIQRRTSPQRGFPHDFPPRPELFFLPPHSEVEVIHSETCLDLKQVNFDHPEHPKILFFFPLFKSNFELACCCCFLIWFKKL